MQLFTIGWPSENQTVYKPYLEMFPVQRFVCLQMFWSMAALEMYTASAEKEEEHNRILLKSIPSRVET